MSAARCVTLKIHEQQERVGYGFVWAHRLRSSAFIFINPATRSSASITISAVFFGPEGGTSWAPQCWRREIPTYEVTT
jgi:hypothetical protein